jgi:prefoldin beta subunit
VERQELEKLTRDYQLIQEQLQNLAVQKEQYNLQKEEHREALAELEKASGKVYINIGGVIVESTKNEAIAKLKERQESVDMRLTIISKQFEDFSKKEKSMREEITKALQSERAQ